MQQFSNSTAEMEGGGLLYLKKVASDDNDEAFHGLILCVTVCAWIPFVHLLVRMSITNGTTSHRGIHQELYIFDGPVKYRIATILIFV